MNIYVFCTTGYRSMPIKKWGSSLAMSPITSNDRCIIIQTVNTTESAALWFIYGSKWTEILL